MGSEQVVAGGFSFSSGNGFTCSRDRTGTSTCWGAQSGMMPLIRSLTPTAFTILSPATHLDLGDGIGCGILASGRLNCWGTLSFDMAVSEPTDISPSGLSGSWVATVDVGVRHMCATSRDGRVFCMGDNSLGQLGQDPASLAEATTLVEVAGLTDAEEVAVSGAATCVRRTGGRVSCWGAENMLGIGSGASVAHPAPVDVPGVTDAQSVVGAAGIGTATCALRADDTLTCWGYDFRVPITGDTAAPDPYTLPGAADVSQFSVGTGYMCLVHREGTANCIGRNFWGTLGDGTTTDSERLVQVALP